MTAYIYTSINDPLGAKGTNALSINAAGQVIGYYYDSSGASHGFLDTGGVFSILDDPSGVGSTVASDINTAGQIVGFYSDSTGISHGFADSGGVFSTLNDPAGAKGTVASGINAAGQIVGNYYDSNGSSHGFLDSGGVFTTLNDPLGAGGTVASGINSAGQIVGAYIDSSGVNHGFLYTGGTYTTLDDPLGAGGTVATGINSAGQIVGYFYSSSGSYAGFVYSGGVYTTLDDPLGIGATASSNINDAGQIVGSYTDSSNLTHGFLANLASIVVGTASNQIFHAGGGNIIFNGTGSHNTIDFDGPSTQYTIVNNGDGSVTTTDSVSGRDGIDQISNVEFLQFTDQTTFLETSDNANIARLYSAALDRTPDTGGLSGWEDFYTNQVSSAAKAQGVYVALAETPLAINGLSIADGFIQSPEFQHTYGSLNNTQFVTQLYENVLDRAPNSAGLNGWLSLMQNQGYTQGMVLVGFAESAENIANSGHWLITV